MDITEIESKNNYQSAVNILDKTGIHFWLDQGTLLGYIRENRLLPWDHDIDFGVWKEQTDKNAIIECFKGKGFKLEEIPMDMDCIHFISQNGKKIDITFYEKAENVITTTWVAPLKGIKNRIIKNISEVLNSSETNIVYSKRGTITQIIFTLLKSILNPAPLSLKRKLQKRLEPLAIKYPEMEIVRFTVPFDIFSEFKQIEFLEKKVWIPFYPERYLAHVYGDDWKVPKIKFDWRQDCGGLETITN